MTTLFLGDTKLNLSLADKDLSWYPQQNHCFSLNPFEIINYNNIILNKNYISIKANLKFLEGTLKNSCDCDDYFDKNFNLKIKNKILTKNIYEEEYGDFQIKKEYLKFNDDFVNDIFEDKSILEEQDSIFNNINSENFFKIFRDKNNEEKEIDIEIYSYENKINYEFENCFIIYTE